MKKQPSSLEQVKITPLRQDILNVLQASKKPLGAYDILGKLKKKRPNAEPPTVYRVLDFLVDAKLVHRIESQNAYVCCSSHTHDSISHQALLLSCQNCKNSFEFEDKNIFASIAKFSKNFGLTIDDALIEMKGLCQNCSRK